MKYEIIQKDLNKIKADASVTFVINKNLNHKWIDKKLFKNLNFNDKSAVLINENLQIFVACKSIEDEELRLASAKAYSLLKTTKAKSVKIGSYLGKCKFLSMKAIVEGFELGSYTYDRYKKNKDTSALKIVKISTQSYNEKQIELKDLQEAIDTGLAMSNSTNYAKDIVNTPPQDFTPLQMEKEAKKLAKLKNVSCKVFDEEFLKKEKMEAFLAVNRASVFPPRLVHLTYKPKNPKKTIIFVGKGLTYDSGGLSLKPSSSMTTMKADKSGAAAVLGIIKGASELNLPFEIHGIIGATENMIGGNAYKPDDVLIARNKTSIEVQNTDAEGRLVLCDCLDYAQDFKPDLLIDMATLTGACVVALGEYTNGILGINEELQQDFFQISKKSGELTTPLYSNRYLDETIKSEIADICNISNTRYGGAITAGVFLSHFIRDEYKNKWLHLDIAGPAFVERAWGYNQYGASGAGVRLNLHYLLHLAKAK